MNIEPVRELVYRVTLDRDGRVRSYEFTLKRLSRPGWFPIIYPPDDIIRDLLDYEWFPPPGQPHGAMTIPPLDKITECVSRIEAGKSYQFPIVLDER